MRGNEPIPGERGAAVNSTQNDRGEWVPAVPMPFLGLRKKCVCGSRFWTLEGYRAHYALVHILALGGRS